MKNSLRISTFILALVTVIAGVSASYASGTRMKSLGMDANTYWMLQKDTAYTFYNPGYYIQFPALITFNEAVSAGSQSPTGGIWLKPMDDLMVVFNVGGSASGEMGVAFAQAPAGVTALAARENYNVAASYKMGNMSFGLRYGSTDNQNKTATQDDGRAWQIIGLGFFMDLGGGMDFDAALKYTTFDYYEKGTAVANKYKADPSDLDITARFNMGLSENNRLHIWLRYNPMDRSDKSGTTKVTYTYDKTTIGVSDELKFTQNAFAYAGFLYDIIALEQKNNTASSKVTTDTTQLSFYMGAQANLTKSITMTMGSNRIWQKSSETKTTVAGVSSKTTVNTDSAVTGTWGLQYKMGHWTIEGLMRRELWTDGPYMISGKANAAGGWAAEFNMAYIFGNTAVYDEEKK